MFLVSGDGLQRLRLCTHSRQLLKGVLDAPGADDGSASHFPIFRTFYMLRVRRHCRAARRPAGTCGSVSFCTFGPSHSFYSARCASVTSVRSVRRSSLCSILCAALICLPCGLLMQSAFVSSALQGKVSLPPCTPFGSAVIPRRSWTLDDHVRKLFKNLSAFRRPILWHRVHFYGRPRGAATLLVNSIFP